MRDRDEQAVSPVIGTILMIAVTVALGAAVYAAVGGMGSDSVESSGAVFKSAAFDTDNDFSTDAIKVTYVSGPNQLGSSAVNVSVTSSSGTWLNLAGTGSGLDDGQWDAGDFMLYDPTSAGKYTVTVIVGSEVVLDKPVSLDA